MGYTYAQRDLIGSLQQENKHLRDELNAFKSGEKYQKMTASFEKEKDKIIQEYERVLRDLKKELTDARKETAQVRRIFLEANEDVLKEKADALALKDREIAKLNETILTMNKKIDTLIKANKELVSDKVALQQEINEKQEKIDTLKKRINKNHQNSSIPSSKERFRGKVSNGRVPSGRKPGAQPGHPGHGREDLVPTEMVEMAVPDWIIESKDWVPITGKEAYKSKKIAECVLSLNVTEYRAYGYRNVSTGEVYYPTLPGNPNLEIEYGDSVKALAFLMNNVMHVPVRNVSLFFQWASAGVMKNGPSIGWINGLCREFAEKTAAEKDEMYNQLLTGDILYTDMTTARVNGILKNIAVCTDKDAVMYFAKNKKGFEGYNNTPVDGFDGTLVHDGDKTLLHYGKYHQLCNSHELRYLQNAIETETNLTWHVRMRDLLKEGIHAHNQAEDHIVPEEIVQDIELRYDEILKVAAAEYHDHPPGIDKEGYNTFLRLKNGKEHMLFYLHHSEVDPSNNVSERCGRKFKSKLNVSGTFRSGKESRSEEANESVGYFCDALGMIETAKNRGKDLYQYALEVFGRERTKATA